ncbi:aldose 1-epimerase family protein [Methylosinus sp. H3A]|uniref:aldose epimerase family protein n=1 Tax=Methylosinus sp. H3A TaxID=2785786 RepID=UPI0018C23A4F|nr:aldose 1-epimerase family protein [Methylosinus sp. H3A]MBG0811612.1 aldose 1-epimerase family protein [Methylosinus sp. H3A]
MSNVIRLQAGPGDTAEVSPLGAELLSWRAEGVDLIWEPQPEVWPQTAPLLFPVVGWTRDGIRVDGAHFPLGLHGFARHKRFAIRERSPETVSLVLEEDEDSRALYPFAFRLEAHFVLRPGELRVSLSATNRDARSLPYAVGLHPGFRWPLGGSAAPHAIHFDAPEQGEVPVIAPGGLLSSHRRAIPLENGRLPLSAELLEKEALCFLGAASRRLFYDNGDGLGLSVELDDFPHIALWALPPAPFLCIEAWTGHGDPEDFRGDLYEKPSMRILAPGESAAHAATFRLERREGSE